RVYGFDRPARRDVRFAEIVEHGEMRLNGIGPLKLHGCLIEFTLVHELERSCEVGASFLRRIGARRGRRARDCESQARDREQARPADMSRTLVRTMGPRPAPNPSRLRRLQGWTLRWTVSACLMGRWIFVGPFCKP